MRELYARRANSDRPLSTRWQPIDIYCAPEIDSAEGEILLRCKLVRSRESAAVCLSEAVSIHVLEAVGLMTADAYCVLLSSPFAEALDHRYEFDPAVRPGRHWGTRLLQENALEVEFTAAEVDLLSAPRDIFMLYLADVVLGHPDRCTYGNVLLVAEESGRRHYLLPIDQSDCFGGNARMADTDSLLGCKERSLARPLEGLDRVVLEGGQPLVDECLRVVGAAKDEIMRAVDVPPDEWYQGSGLHPDTLAEFLEYRLDHLEELSRADHWRGLASATEGGRIL